MLIEMFVLGSVAFWALIVVVSLFGFVCAAWDNLWWLGMLTILVTVLALVLTGNLADYLQVAHLWLIPGWLGCGLVWSFPRWVIFLRKGKRAFDEVVAWADLATEVGRNQFYRSVRLHQAKQDWGFDYRDDKLYPPQAKEQKGRITTWILLWPWNLIWTIIGDGLVELTHWIVERLSTLYQRIADHVYKG